MESVQKTITIKVSEEQHKAAKIAAARAGKTLKDIFLEAIEKLIDEQKDGDR